MEQEQGECSTAAKRPRRSAYREGHRSKLSIPYQRTTSNMTGNIATLPNFSHFSKARITLHLPLTSLGPQAAQAQVVCHMIIIAK